MSQWLSPLFARSRNGIHQHARTAQNRTLPARPLARSRRKRLASATAGGAGLVVIGRLDSAPRTQRRGNLCSRALSQDRRRLIPLCGRMRPRLYQGDGTVVERGLPSLHPLAPRQRQQPHDQGMLTQGRVPSRLPGRRGGRRRTVKASLG